MGFLDDVSAKLGQAADSGDRKVQEVKLNGRISNMQKQRASLINDLGEAVYNAKANDEAFVAEFLQQFTAVKNIDAQIAQVELERAQLSRNVQPNFNGPTCPYCGNPLNLDDAFCMGCGKPMAEVKSHLAQCPSCGAYHSQDVAFCTSCGAKMVSAGAEQGANEGTPAGSSCPKCGLALPEESVFCPGCGEKIA